MLLDETVVRLDGLAIVFLPAARALSPDHLLELGFQHLGSIDVEFAAFLSRSPLIERLTAFFGALGS